MEVNRDDLVSIIVPVYNVEKYIEQTMDSVRAQTYTQWELLLVEDGSSDGTPEVIAEYMQRTNDGRIRLVTLPENIGAARAPATLDFLRRREDISHIWIQMMSGCPENWSISSFLQKRNRRHLRLQDMNLQMSRPEEPAGL